MNNRSHSPVTVLGEVGTSEPCLIKRAHISIQWLRPLQAACAKKDTAFSAVLDCWLIFG